MRKFLPLLLLSCSLNSFHAPRALDESDAAIGVSWTAFPLREERSEIQKSGEDTTVLRILGFPTVWLKYGLKNGTELGMGVALFRYTPEGSDRTVSSITASPYIKKELITLGPIMTSGFMEAGAGTGRFFIAGSDSSWDTASSAFYGSGGLVPGLELGYWEVWLPVKYTFGYIPTLVSAGYVSLGPGVSYAWSGHRVFLEAAFHYAGDGFLTYSAGGGFDF